MKKISIAIPTYEMNGVGVKFLRELLDTIRTQTFQNFEVCISDHSLDESISNVCKDYSKYFDIKYRKNQNERGNGPANTNSSIEMCSGEYIKIIFQDDLFINDEALGKINERFEETGCDWLFNGFMHTSNGRDFGRPMVPQWTDALLEGRNLMGAPSNVSFKADKFLGFDPKLKLLMDTDFYHRMQVKWGMPEIIKEKLVASRIHQNSISSSRVNYNYTVKHPQGGWPVNKEELIYALRKNNKVSEFL
jgi:glycosyltransferase involved in cell wall biosynthesis